MFLFRSHGLRVFLLCMAHSRGTLRPGSGALHCPLDGEERDPNFAASPPPPAASGGRGRLWSPKHPRPSLWCGRTVGVGRSQAGCGWPSLQLPEKNPPGRKRRAGCGRWVWRREVAAVSRRFDVNSKRRGGIQDAGDSRSPREQAERVLSPLSREHERARLVSARGGCGQPRGEARRWRVGPAAARGR